MSEPASTGITITSILIVSVLLQEFESAVETIYSEDESGENNTPLITPLFQL